MVHLLYDIIITDDKSDLLNPMGTVEKNPNVDSAAGLLIRFPNIRPHPLYYPPLDKVRILKRLFFMSTNLQFNFYNSQSKNPHLFSGEWHGEEWWCSYCHKRRGKTFYISHFTSLTQLKVKKKQTTAVSCWPHIFMNMFSANFALCSAWN